MSDFDTMECTKCGKMVSKWEWNGGWCVDCCNEAAERVRADGTLAVAVVAEISRLKRELAVAKTDTERLDWLHRRAAEATIQTESGCKCGSCKEWVVEPHWDTGPIGRGETIRKAIDDAMSKAVPVGKGEINQCDGCRRRLPVRDGLHIDKTGHPFMGCTKDRYEGKA